MAKTDDRGYITSQGEGLVIPFLCCQSRSLPDNKSPFAINRVAGFTGRKLHPADAGMRSDNLPADIKRFQVHRSGSHNLLSGSWERERPPSESQGHV